MSLDLHSLAGVLIPFAGTSLGAAGVLFLKRDLTLGLRRGLTGFAAGVMVAASIWSLLIPAIDRSASLGTWAFSLLLQVFGAASCFCWHWTV